MGMRTKVKAAKYTPSERACKRTTLIRGVSESALYIFEDGTYASEPAPHLLGVFLDTTHPYSERRRNRRRPGECRAELTKYAAARPLFALRAGRMAASGIICRGIFLGSDVALTRAPKVPPKIVGSPPGGMIFGGTRRRGLLYSHARGTSPDQGRLGSHSLIRSNSGPPKSTGARLRRARTLFGVNSGPPKSTAGRSAPETNANSHFLIRSNSGPPKSTGGEQREPRTLFGVT